jgi:glycosyltransferase involved in cell wall biosynthesis
MSSESSHPFFSVITPVLNASATLGEAMRSVVAQTGPTWEHLILDGLSTDGSVEVARSFAGVQVWSEADGGLYEAMNRGVERARGEWLVFLQADDWLPPDAFTAWAEGIQSEPGAVIVTGGARAVRFLADGSMVEQWRREEAMEKPLDFSLLALGEPMINARVFRRDWFLSQGGFSLEYQLASDREFLLRAALGRARHAMVAPTVYFYRWHEQSRTMNAGHAANQKLTCENLAIAEAFLRQEVPARERYALRIWHRQESVRWAMNALESKQWDALSEARRRGRAYSLGWDLALLWEILRSLPGWVARGGRTRSQAQERPKMA